VGERENRREASTSRVGVSVFMNLTFNVRLQSNTHSYQAAKRDKGRRLAVQGKGASITIATYHLQIYLYLLGRIMQAKGSIFLPVEMKSRVTRYSGDTPQFSSPLNIPARSGEAPVCLFERFDI
jgi:hypothetical protein